MHRITVRSLISVVVLATIGSRPAAAGETSLPAAHPDVTRWERDVAALEALDGRQADPPDAILFLGSLGSTNAMM